MADPNSLAHAQEIAQLTQRLHVAETRVQSQQRTIDDLTRFFDSFGQVFSTMAQDTNLLSQRNEDLFRLAGLQNPRRTFSLSTANRRIARQETIATMPEYKLNRSIDSIAEVWREWRYGFDGGPAVSDLESRWGSRWRSKGSEKQQFLRRKVIINEITRQGGDDDERCRIVAEELETVRKREGMSCWQMIQRFKAQNRDRDRGGPRTEASLPEDADMESEHASAD